MRTIEPVNPLSRVPSQAFAEPGSARVDASRTPFVIREVEGKGRGVFSAQQLAEGQVAIVGKPISTSPHRTWQTVQMDADTHVRMDEPFELVNHSCDPTCGIKPNRYGGYDLVAMRSIAAGEEITFDYCMTEWFCVGFRKCQCNSRRCRKVIRGAKFLFPAKLAEYDGYTAPYLRPLCR